METTPVRVWSGVYEALQVAANSKAVDASALASMLLMTVMFQDETLPEAAKTLLAEEFFGALGEGVRNNKSELAKWAVSIMKGKPG
ncbi:MAG TPA: hypothetical protein VGX00_05170 [Thermoplasmata archaeon]|nr:hypothetical protein [Nitrososphaerales archaeon]HEV2519996.1 hypothetical protein [Thermoplasmata archaeon]